jgi:hypothetical protein
MDDNRAYLHPVGALMSDVERIAFLEQQLAGAVMFLRQKDATEEACAKRLEGIYQASFADMRRQLETQAKQVKELEARLGAASTRYSFARQHMVQVWKLGIAASGERLDELLDEQIERMNKQQAVKS